MRRDLKDIPFQKYNLEEAGVTELVSGNRWGSLKETEMEFGVAEELP